MWRKAAEKKPYKFTQEFGSKVERSWTGAEVKNIIWWAHRETPINPYGKALAFTLEDSIEFPCSVTIMEGSYSNSDQKITY
jgi:hypothetical protein